MPAVEILQDLQVCLGLHFVFYRFLIFHGLLFFGLHNIHDIRYYIMHSVFR